MGRDASRRTVSVGVDVDSLRHYYEIHGLDPAPATNAAWKVGVGRFVELFAELGLPASFYCVASDLQSEGNRKRLRALVSAGHEIGNHTWHHRYDLVRLPAALRWVEVAEGRRRLAEAAGAPVIGFRAPGYNTGAALQRDVRLAGHAYESSVFPCAPYYLAKAAVMGGQRLVGRRSRSVLGDPAVLWAPRRPHPVEGGLRQFPIGVVGGLPLIGTAFTALGLGAAGLLARAAARWPIAHLTVEFHALDLLSLADDGLDPALRVQPDLRVGVARKRRIFRRVLKALGRGAQFVRLADLCAAD